ncbi:hypothetical protein ScPMuIL_015786 [Solemya velum]
MGEEHLVESVPDGADDSDVLDPRIQVELNRLNQTSAEINRLENELDEARSKYKATFSEASRNMETLAMDIKRNIQQAREYYNFKEEARKCQGEALKAARQFQTASGIYRAAKETIALAEEKLLQTADHTSAHLSSAWQEMLNHATVRVMEAEKEKSRSELEHRRKSARFAEVEHNMQFLEKRHRRSISKARPYFEAKAQLNVKLQQLKQNVDDLQEAIKSFKVKYSDSLRCLEEISTEIHHSRRNKLILSWPRSPGVGAEHDPDSCSSSLSELVLHTPEDVDSSASEWTQDSDPDQNECTVFNICVSQDSSNQRLQPCVYNGDNSTAVREQSSDDVITNRGVCDPDINITNDCDSKHEPILRTRDITIGGD